MVEIEEEFTEAQKELLDMGIVLDSSTKRHQRPVPGLRQVSESGTFET